MRIAIDARELTGAPTGVGRYLSAVLAAWNEIPAAADHEFILCAPEPVAAVTANLSIRTLTSPGAGTMWEQRALPRLVRGAAADVLFAPAYTGPVRCPVPMVLTIHDVSFLSHPEWFGPRERVRRRIVTWLAARRAARVLTVSGFSKREIVAQLGIGASKVDVVYHGVTRLTVREGDGERRNAPLVLYVGSIFNRRHLPALVEGFARLARRTPGARLEIVGDNRTRPHIDLADLVARTAAADRIRVRSYVPDEELARLYGTGTAFAFLSEYEGFGLTPLEALAAGMPIVVLDTDVAREIYGAAACYVAEPDPPLVEAALERVLFDEAERERLRGAAAAVLERYSWRECGHRTLQALLACGHPHSRFPSGPA